MVYRPPRKKTSDDPRFPANRPSADPLEGPLQGATHPDDPRAGDDRNLVMVDQNFAEADIEDRAWLFWQKRRKVVYGLVALVFLGALGWAGWVYYQKQALADAQAAYLQANDAASLLAFGHANAGTPLARVALLQGADDLYSKGQYKDAAAAYADAAAAWSGEPVSQRANLGHALSLVQGGDPTTGQTELETLANNLAVPDNFRAEAGYYVAVLSLQAGDSTGARTWIDKVQALPGAGAWGRQANDLAELAPALGLAVKVAPSTAPETTISAPGLSPYVPTNMPQGNTPNGPASSSLLVPGPATNAAPTPAAPTGP
ncbi:MAG: tetratricopeptide repeat protein [Opitutales bacterium]|jgi:hypothetical protein